MNVAHFSYPRMLPLEENCNLFVANYFNRNGPTSPVVENWLTVSRDCMVQTGRMSC